jgi:hypothetical protein
VSLPNLATPSMSRDDSSSCVGAKLHSMHGSQPCLFEVLKRSRSTSLKLRSLHGLRFCIYLKCTRRICVFKMSEKKPLLHHFFLKSYDAMRSGEQKTTKDLPPAYELEDGGNVRSSLSSEKQNS